jgi:hypothetical protein
MQFFTKGKNAMNDKQQTKAIDALNLVIERIGRHTLAEICKVGVTATYAWEVCPPQHVLIVQEVAGVPASWLRPDYYPSIEVSDV